jgi:hypothetical protein
VQVMKRLLTALKVTLATAVWGSANPPIFLARFEMEP